MASLFNPPLYPTEAEIARMVLGSGARAAEWQGLATALEMHGLPKISPMTGRRYWPAVRAFFDNLHGLSATLPAPIPGGLETPACKTPAQRPTRRALSGAGGRAAVPSHTG
jgi:hypothetical protein